MGHGSLYFLGALLRRCWIGLAVVLGAVGLGVLAFLLG